MPRNRSLVGTSAHPRDTGSFVPYLKSFCDLLEPSDCISTTDKILEAYLRYISIRSGNIYIDQAETGFRRSFRTIALNRKWRESSKPRGYYVMMPRISRKVVGTNNKEHVKNYKFERLFIDKNVGYGVFAPNDIAYGVCILEYKGQWICKSESEIREKYYAETNCVPVSVYDLSTKKVLDANRDEEGQLYEPNENIARYINHSKKSPNCKLVAKQDPKALKRLYLVTISNIPKGAQLLWDYGDRSYQNIAANPWLTA